MWYNRTSKSCAKISTVRHIRPMLEMLEDRTIPSVNIIYSGGPTIPHVQINNIVMGPQPINTTILMQDLVRDYLPLLGSYYGIGAGALRSSISVAPLPGNPSNAQIQNFILQEINRGALPPPGGNQVYVTFLAPGQSTSELAGSDATGYHSNFSVYHNATGYHIATVVPFGTPMLPVYYAVCTGTHSISITASHELAESVTDPNGAGFRDPTNPFGGEVADIYEFLDSFNVDGFPVAVLSGPQGQKIGVDPSGTPQDFLALIFEEAEALAFRYLAALDPRLVPTALEADIALSDNPFFGTSQGQIGMLLGEMLFYSWLSQ